MLTIGIDLAAQPQDTAACEVRWHQTHAEIVDWHNHLSDEKILSLIEKADKSELIYLLGGLRSSSGRCIDTEELGPIGEQDNVRSRFISKLKTSSGRSFQISL